MPLTDSAEIYTDSDAYGGSATVTMMIAVMIVMIIGSVAIMMVLAPFMLFRWVVISAGLVLIAGTALVLVIISSAAAFTRSARARIARTARGFPEGVPGEQAKRRHNDCGNELFFHNTHLAKPLTGSIRVCPVGIVI
jgi:hypothetical protein